MNSYISSGYGRFWTTFLESPEETEGINSEIEFSKHGESVV